MGLPGKPGIEVCGTFLNPTHTNSMIKFIFPALQLIDAMVFQLFYYTNNSLQCLPVVSWLYKVRLLKSSERVLVFQGPRGPPGLSGPPGPAGREVSEISVPFHSYSLPHTSADKRWLEA